MTAPLVSLRGLRVAFPDRARKPLFGAAPMIEVVKGIDLDIPRGEALGLVGESGSGKTTIGRALVRLIRPSAGALVYDGVDIAAFEEEQVRPLRAKLQMIFQDPQSSLNPRLTIGTTLVRPLEAFGRGGDAAARRKRAGELLDIVGLPDRVPRPLPARDFRRPAPARRHRPARSRSSPSSSSPTRSSPASTCRPRRRFSSSFAGSAPSST